MNRDELLEQGEARRDAIVDFIASYTEEHGYPPAVREIMKAVGLSSPNSVRLHLRTLQDEGKIRMTPGIARSIVIVQ